jgi:hypothetical protein
MRRSLRAARLAPAKESMISLNSRWISDGLGPMKPMNWSRLDPALWELTYNPRVIN